MLAAASYHRGVPFCRYLAKKNRLEKRKKKKGIDVGRFYNPNPSLSELLVVVERQAEHRGGSISSAALKVLTNKVEKSY